MVKYAVGKKRQVFAKKFFCANSVPGKTPAPCRANLTVGKNWVLLHEYSHFFSLFAIICPPAGPRSGYCLKKRNKIAGLFFNLKKNKPAPITRPMRYLLGYDLGSSSIKAALVDAGTGRCIGVARSPRGEMKILAQAAGMAEQQPSQWWDHLCLATQKLLRQTRIDPRQIKAMGIAYQMHGLVLVDKNGQVLRPAIIWCDSRAVEIGEKALEETGREKCLSHLLNPPGNFTASKLRWVIEHEPQLMQRAHKMLLPGDYIALRLTGEMTTTPGGLSEAIMWDFKKNQPADFLLDYFSIGKELLPAIVPACSPQGRLIRSAARQLGLPPGIPLTYRAGDQPNNALSLNVLSPGEVAATGGTSGVVYGLTDRLQYDSQGRINSFAHVNHTPDRPRIGLLLCLNGAGIQYAWMRREVAPPGTSFDDMESLAQSVPIGSDGLRILPFGNGAERMLANRDIGARIHHLQFNRHGRAHLYRAALEGVAFSFVYGMKILKKMGIAPHVVRAGNDNLFRSAVFSSTLSHLSGCRIELLQTTGAAGAAKAAGVAAGIYASLAQAMQSIKVVKIYEPRADVSQFEKYYQLWEADLKKALS